MSTDTPATESTAPLSVNQAAALFTSSMEPEQPKPEAKAADPAKADPEKVPEATEVKADPEQVEEQPASDETITIEVDGKTVELKKSELADHYKNGLRQADYTRKTMETAEQRKAAEAETNKAREERARYAQGLHQAQTLLQAQLHEMSQVDWAKLLETDPVEYMKQDRIARERQAQLQRVQFEQQHLTARFQAEQADQFQTFIQSQQQELLAKLPEWKDETKAKAEREAITSYLKEHGYTDKEVGSIADHRAVLLSRKAMLYDQMMGKAQAAAKKVAQLPQRVEKTGVTEANPLDRRTVAMKQFEKTGNVRDAAKVFSSLL